MTDFMLSTQDQITTELTGILNNLVDAAELLQATHPEQAREIAVAAGHLLVAVRALHEETQQEVAGAV